MKVYGKQFKKGDRVTWITGAGTWNGTVLRYIPFSSMDTLYHIVYVQPEGGSKSDSICFSGIDSEKLNPVGEVAR